MVLLNFVFVGHVFLRGDVFHHREKGMLVMTVEFVIKSPDNQFPVEFFGASTVLEGENAILVAVATSCVLMARRSILRHCRNSWFNPVWIP